MQTMNSNATNKSKTKKIIKEVLKVLAGTLIPLASRAIGVDILQPVLDVIDLIF